MAKEKDVNREAFDEDAYLELLKETQGEAADFDGSTEFDAEIYGADNFEEADDELDEENFEHFNKVHDENVENSDEDEDEDDESDEIEEFEDISSNSQKEKNVFKRIAAWYKRLPKGKKIAATVGAVFILILVILIIVAAVFVINKFARLGTNIDDPLSYDDTIYEEQDFSELSGQIGSSDFHDALYEWATAGGEDTIMSSKNVINVLLIGADSRAGTNSGNTDVMMVISLNKKTKEIKMTSIFRDCYLYIEPEDSDGYYFKLNSAYRNGGIDCLINTIQNNFKIKIDNYVMVNFESFKEVINAMGGVTVDVQEYEANYIENHYKISMPIGENVTLNGEQALIFSRVRGCDADADVSRTRRQRQVINAIMNEFQSASLTNLNKYVDTVLPYIYTGFSKSEIISLGMKALAGGWVSYPRTEYQMPPADARYGINASNTLGAWVWLVDYQLAAYCFQTEVYGTSNIVLEDGRRTLIDIYFGNNGTGSSSGSADGKPVKVPETTVPVSGEETTVPVSGEETTAPESEVDVSQTENISEPVSEGETLPEVEGGGEGDGNEPEVTEPASENNVPSEAQPAQ